MIKNYLVLISYDDRLREYNDNIKECKRSKVVQCGKKKSITIVAKVGEAMIIYPATFSGRLNLSKCRAIYMHLQWCGTCLHVGQYHFPLNLVSGVSPTHA